MVHPVLSLNACTTHWLQCPLWVKSGHVQCTSHVRFTPNSGHRPDRRLNSSGQDYIKILRGGVQDFIKIALDQKRPPPLVEPPFESFDFAFEPNRLDLLYFALNLETIYDVALSAEFGKLARALPFEFFNPDLKLAS